MSSVGKRTSFRTLHGSVLVTGYVLHGRRVRGDLCDPEAVLEKAIVEEEEGVEREVDFDEWLASEHPAKQPHERERVAEEIRQMAIYETLHAKETI